MSSETIAKKASATIAARNQDGSLSPAHLDSIDQEVPMWSNFFFESCFFPALQIEALLSLRQRLHELVQQAQYLQVVIRASTLATQQYQQQQQQQQQQAEQQRQNHYQQAAEHNVPRVQQMTTLKNDFVPFMILPEPKPSLASDSYASGKKQCTSRPFIKLSSKTLQAQTPQSDPAAACQATTASGRKICDGISGPVACPQMAPSRPCQISARMAPTTSPAAVLVASMTMTCPALTALLVTTRAPRTRSLTNPTNESTR